jgi:hypothetical protein
MGNNQVPFDPDEICDVCGAKGAYDFMGDCFCGECLNRMQSKDEDSTPGGRGE